MWAVCNILNAGNNNEMKEFEVDEHKDPGLSEYVESLCEFDVDDDDRTKNKNSLSLSNVSRLSDCLWELRCLFEHQDEEDSIDESPEFTSFLSDNSDMREEILIMLDEIEATGMLEGTPDPNLEEVLVGLVDEVINTSHQMTDFIKRNWGGGEWSGRSYHAIGGRGKLGRVWELLKEVRRVVGVKRKLSDADWASSETSADSVQGDANDLHMQQSDDEPRYVQDTSSLPGLETASESSPGSINSEDISLLRRRLGVLEVDNGGEVPGSVGGEPVGEMAAGDVVEVAGVERVLVPMFAVGYPDDMVLVPGPVVMDEAARLQHIEEERLYDEWLQDHPGRFPDDQDEGDSETGSDSGVGMDLGAGLGNEE